MTSATKDGEIKGVAADVVLGYRRVDWSAVERGESEAVAALREAVATDEDARGRLAASEDAVAQKLIDGLDRFHAAEVAPRWRSTGVLAGLSGEATEMRSRPPATRGDTVRMNTGCGHLYVTVNETEDGRPFELFNHMGKAGGCASSQNEAMGRLISYALRCGAQLEPLIRQLKGISCHRPAWGAEGKISSCADAVGKSLEQYLRTKEERVAAQVAAQSSPGTVHTNGVSAPDAGADAAGEVGSVSFGGRLAERLGGGSHEVQMGACVECGSQLSFEEGCVKCHSCGFTECG